MNARTLAMGLALGAWVLGGSIAARGQVIRGARVAPVNRAVAGTVNLPHSIADNQGNQWMFYQTGQFQQQGNMPVYSQGAMLQVNNAGLGARGNQGRIDEKTGELVIENLAVGNLSLTRRILVNKEEGYVRYIDIFKNTSNQEQTPVIQLQTHLNYGVQMASTVADPKRRDQNIAWVAQTHANGRTVVDMFAGKAAKQALTINYQQGNSMVQASISPRIPAGKEVAIMHFHHTTNTMDQAQRFVLSLKESKIMAAIPPAIRRLIINFRGGENFIGDYEILRGETLDVIELRSGDQLRGTIKEKTYRLEAFYGTIELPVEKVIGLINAGEFRPRQLLVTRDGEIFGGKLAADKLSLELSSGQVTQVPVSQVSRMGYRKRPDEPEEWTFDKPMILMRTGDRIGIAMPAADLPVVTRYGALSIAPQSLAAVNFQAEEHGVHDILLTDGSRFAGLVASEVFDMKLAGEGPEQVVKFPASSVRRLQLSARPSEVGDDDATLALANEDMLVGSLSGQLKLDTAFSTIEVDAPQIKRIVHIAGAPADVQVTLWDDTTISGQLQEQDLSCRLKSGITLRVPVAVVQEYRQPRPQPSAAAMEIIREIVTDLSADDVQRRDLAQEKLFNMGPVISDTLRQVRGSQPPEGQQRIDAILKQFSTQPGEKAGDGGAATPVAPMAE